jgi:probable F420-dependent oxidoreductase
MIKVGIGLFWGGMEPEDLTTVAARADELGYESVWIWEHLVYPRIINSKYPYSPDGKPPFADDRTLDPWVTLAHIAAVTKNIRLGTNIYILPLRNPFITARAVLTLDILSGGRAILGAGVGWLEEEYDLLGESFHDRGKRAEEIVAVLKALWIQREPQFHGQFYDFGPVRFEPKPLQKPHPPIIFGGETDAAMRRAARIGDGWISSGALETPETAAAKVAKLRAWRREAGREKDPFDVTMVGGAWLEPPELKRFEEAGVTRLLMAPWFAPQMAKAMAEEGTARAWAKERLGAGSVIDNILQGLERYAAVFKQQT